MLALAKIFFACSGIMSKILLRANPDFLLSSPNATADSASNFVNTTTTGTKVNAIISYRIGDVVTTTYRCWCHTRRKTFPQPSWSLGGTHPLGCNTCNRENYYQAKQDVDDCLPDSMDPFLQFSCSCALRNEFLHLLEFIFTSCFKSAWIMKDEIWVTSEH